jgi:drug/metabolite transporter (DMT)-like permease
VALLIVAVFVAAVAKRRRGGGASPWKWIAILGLVLVGLPLLVFILGVALVTPVRVERSSMPAAEAVVVTVGPTAAPDRTWTPSAATPSPMSPPNPAPVNDTGARSWSIVPETWLEALAIPLVIAALTVFVGAAVIALIRSRWPGGGADERGAPSRYLLLALALCMALSLFLVLDLGLGFAVSIYSGFVAAYAAFWVLVGALLLRHRPGREKVLILVLFVSVLFSVRFIDWNSLKPFLKHFNRIKEGMTASQVDEIMSEYWRGQYGGPPLSLRELDPQFDEQGRIVRGRVTYRHTDEGWGNSDWGVVAYEDGRVVGTEFLAD